MANDTSPAELTAFEGPDDWVSLYLDGVGEDVLADSEFSDIPSTHPMVNGGVSMAAEPLAPKTAVDRFSGTLGPQDTLVVQDLCLPSLDDLLADDNPADADGLFSGFQTLSNQEMDMLSGPDQEASHSHQHSNTVSGTTSEGPTNSDGSDGELSQAKAPSNSALAPQHHAQFRQAAGATTDSPAADNTGFTSAASPSTEQQAQPSLAGMTAAQVAKTLGLDAAKQPQAQQGKNSAPPLPAQVPARKQANGRKKRGRDMEAEATSNGTSGQNASSTVAADMASRAGSPGVSSSSDVTPAEVQQEPASSANTVADGEEHKRMARMQRNRESAHQSRQRKRMQVEEVEQRCEQLKQHNSQLNQLVGRLTAETIGLKQQLVHVCQQTGHPLPPPPPSAMHPYGFGQLGLPMLVPAPKVPIQKIPTTRPAPASSSHHVPSGAANQRPANAQSSGQPPKARKRAKQAAGAGTVLLALFSFVVFLGPLGPLAGPRLSSSTPTLGYLPSPASLPGFDSMGGHMGSGRVLMAIGSNSSDGQKPPSLQNNQTALQLLVDNSLILHEEAVSLAEDAQGGVVADNFSGQGKAVSEGWRGKVSEGAHVAPFKSLLLRPSNKKAEVQALQGLKDVAPLVLYSQRDQVFSQVSGQSPWQHALPGLAKEDGLGLSGFRSPSMCKEVFQFEAQDTTAVQATQHVQRFLTGGSSMRGSGSIALPPVTPIQDLDKTRTTNSRKKTIGCGEDDPGVVVSVMLPAQAEGSAVNEFTSLDQLYVVVLTPGVKYSTYSCLLPKAVLV